MLGSLNCESDIEFSSEIYSNFLINLIILLLVVDDSENSESLLVVLTFQEYANFLSNYEHKIAKFTFEEVESIPKIRVTGLIRSGFLEFLVTLLFGVAGQFLSL